MADVFTLLAAAILLALFVRYIILGETTPATSATPSSQPARPHRPVPSHQTETVLQMFPHFPRHTIELDLSRTRSVEQTCENILTGKLVAPPPPVNPVPETQQPLRRPTGQQSSNAFLAGLDLTKEADAGVGRLEELKVWESTPEARERSLRQRKEIMVRQARQKLLGKSQKAADGQAAIVSQ
ncbi:hypothetical protein HKX48_000822 [Thoreauomyces humboldtii]|nr:hypothetical protein HKX48_000822 [Thoreauomyces humboldtii]